MSRGSENSSDWRPGCDLDALRQRAGMLARIRRYFQEAGLLEVETPLLDTGVGTDPHLQFFIVPSDFHHLYLQTSPEFAMKRLLAAGVGSMYQICKAFRGGESGRLHNPEFTLLEWYRVGFGLNQMMDEVASLLQLLLEGRVAGQSRLSYSEVFQASVGVPWDAPFSLLSRQASALGLKEGEQLCGQNRSLWLDFLFSHVVQPKLPTDQLVFVYDYPVALAALARLKPGQPQTAERFEVFVNSIELGNGYRELTDPNEQRARFEAEQKLRFESGLPCPGIDEALLAALESGLPECSGVAVGLDRVLMLVMGHDSIERVLAFPLRAVF